MKKSKFMKSLLALGLGMVSAIGAFGLNACDNGGGSGNGGNNGDNGDGAKQLTAPHITLDDATGKITWSQVDNADSYVVYEKASTATNATEVQTVTAPCEYTITQSTIGIYDYYVVATSASENYTDSGKSNTVTYEVQAATGNAILPTYTGNGPALTEGSEQVKYSFLASDLDAGTHAEGWKSGVFSLPANSVTRSRSKGTVYTDDTVYSNDSYSHSLQMTTNNSSALVLEAPSAGTLYIHVQNGSSGVAEQTLTVVKPNGTDSIKYTGEIDGVKNSSRIQRLAIQIDRNGTYTIKAASGTSDIYFAEFVVTLETTPIAKIEVVNKGKSDYLLTQKLDCTGIEVNAIQTGGKIVNVNLSNLVFDTSAYDPTVSGTYNIGVSYTVDGNLTSTTTTFTTTYQVKVYTVSSIQVFTTLSNGSEKQTTLKQAYLPNETLSTTGLTVKATGKLGQDEAEFTMNKSDYAVTADLTTEGQKQATISVDKAFTNGATVENTYDIVVKAKKDVVGNEVTLTVGETGEFKTITHAVNYLVTCKYADSVIKTINIADGEYKEKVHVDTPNVHFIGSATNTPDHDTDNGVVIWYDAANGLLDPSGMAYGTKGSSTVIISANATGFTAENITFKNYYNTAERYYDLKDNQHVAGTQAVALMVECEGGVFKNCKMTGYQDTLYPNKGKQFYHNCWIEGRTDYIFGADAIPYFYECTIYTVSAGSNDKNGGYIVAYQNTSAAYGPVFNKCDITGASTGATNISLGRAWGKECHMVTLNSTISGNYSKTAHTKGTSSGQRYVTMSGNEPKPANMLEYNNTGDGAITASIDNTCTVMSETDAAKYQIEQIATLLGFNPLA